MTYAKLVVNAIGQLVKEGRGQLIIMPKREYRNPRPRRVRCKILEFSKKHALLLLAALALAFTVPAFSQQAVVSCTNQTIGGGEFTVCQSRGMVRVVESDAHNYWSAWFTRSQFNAWKVKHQAAWDNKHTNRKSESQAQSWHTQEYCEADGFLWRDGGCHAR
jgi:hypothetical protein